MNAYNVYNNCVQNKFEHAKRVNQKSQVEEGKTTQ